MTDGIEISVVICTRDRRAYLESCLKALTRQTLPAQSCEIVIVDNGSTDGTQQAAQAFCERHANSHYVYEGRAGLAIARNTGVRAAKAEIVAFTDDDAEPDPTWLERLLGRFREHPGEIGVVGGEVIPVWEAKRPEWLSDRMLRPLSAGLHWGNEARFLRPGEWLVEVNSAYCKAALARIGGFPEHLGRIDNVLLSGEGVINVLIERAGFRLFYDPAILVRHHIPKSRCSRAWFRRRSFWQGVSLNLVHRYLDETAAKLGLPDVSRHKRMWEEIPVPTSPSAWADLFDDHDVQDFGDQLYQLEQLGYLFESQSVVVGR
jgi:glucosyl-dolichyl phosphate glucuronosyltransferase